MSSFEEEQKEDQNEVRSENVTEIDDVETKQFFLKSDSKNKFTV